MRFVPLDENDRLTRKKFTNKRATAKIRGIEFSLSYVEYKSLLVEAGINPSMIGQRSDDYCLGRVNDEGGYEYGNCRFITIKENTLEGRVSKPLHGLSLGGGSRESLTGLNHWNNKGNVSTPWGEFSTLKSAADHPSALVSRSQIGKLIAKGAKGYKYIS